MKLQARNSKGQFTSAKKDRYTFKVDSGGNRKYFDRGSRITSAEWKAVKVGEALLEAEKKESRKDREDRRRREHRKRFPVQAAEDPGKLTRAGYYSYFAEGYESATFTQSGEINIVDRIEGAIAPGTPGASQGSHIKDMGITHLASVVSVDDAASQLLDFLLEGSGSIENVKIDAIYWDVKTGSYAVEWYYDFSEFYQADEEEEEEGDLTF